LNWVDGTPVNYAVPATWTTATGTAEIGYRIERAPVSNGVIGAYAVIATALANKTTYTDTTAVAGQRYSYRVVAFNAAGNSASTPITVPAPTAPGAPTIGIATPANASAVVRWTAPVDTGGSAITGYAVRVFSGATQVGLDRLAAAGATSLTVTGLTNGTAYTFKVLATNAIGNSVASAASNPVTPGATAAVTKLTDFNRDGNTDLIARDAAGNLWLYRGDGTGGFLAAVNLGTGWNGLTALASPGDMTGDGNADVMGRDTAGTMWLYPGNGTSGLTTRRSLGTGWNAYSTITAAGDMIAGGRPDLFALDSTTGILWVYPYTGNAVGGTRVQVRTGLTGFTITGPGDISGDGRADVLARNGAGLLFSYLGSGTGTAAAGVQVGTANWSAFTALVTPGNWDKAVGNDLLTRDAAGSLWLNPGNNASNFVTPRVVGTGWAGFNYIG
ncbi:MAG TPA: fibronectin type III domain-containing protein, partial [Dermatophilaceae bacterium]